MGQEPHDVTCQLYRDNVALIGESRVITVMGCLQLRAWHTR